MENKLFIELDIWLLIQETLTKLIPQMMKQGYAFNGNPIKCGSTPLELNLNLVR